MVIFLNDVLGGIILVLSLILLIVAIVTYCRYHIKAALLSAVIFFLFLVKALIYEVAAYLGREINLVGTFLIVDIVILVTLYFVISLRG